MAPFVPPELGLAAAGAAEWNTAAMARYSDGKAAASGQPQLTSAAQFSDLRPGDWAYQALRNLVERYGCVAGYPGGSFEGQRSLSRYEAAALLNSCMDRVFEITDELRRLLQEFGKELAVIRGRVDGLEAKVGELEATQFSTTTKLDGMAVFVVGANAFGGSARDLVNQARNSEGATSFNYDLELNIDTSFSGKDLLHTVLRAGNFASSVFGNGGLNELEVAFQQDCGTEANCGDVVAIDKIFYQFPIGSQWMATVGGRVGQEDMLALTPSLYPDDTILNVFTFNGAPAAYNRNLGPGGGLWWKTNSWSVSANYVAAVGDIGDPGLGGIGNGNSQGAGTVQVAYARPNWALAGVYSHVQQNTEIPGSTPFAAGDWNRTGPGHVNAFGLSGYWQPQTSGWVPSISVGWGYNAYDYDQAVPGGSLQTSQSWSVGLQWQNAFAEANTLGLALGQPVFATGLSAGQTPDDGNYAFELWYKFQATDHIAITPAIFYLSRPEGQNTPVGQSFDNFGALVKTTFKF